MTARLDDASKLLMWPDMNPITRRLMDHAFGMNEEMVNIYRESVGIKHLGGGVRFFTAPEPDLTPNHIRQMQDALNAMSGDSSWKDKIIVLPYGSKVTDL